MTEIDYKTIKNLKKLLKKPYIKIVDCRHNYPNLIVNLNDWYEILKSQDLMTTSQYGKFLMPRYKNEAGLYHGSAVTVKIKTRKF